MKNFIKILFSTILAFVFSSFVFTSCEVGLGAAVDTAAPKVDITYPPSLSIIRDTFVFAGTWSDDMGVKVIKVDVYQSKDDGKTLVVSEEAAIAEDGNWSLSLNKYDPNNSAYFNGWEFSDGDYEIQVLAEDNAKHTSGVASRSFSIDNTAPVLVLTKPTSAGGNPRPYGQAVQLEGTFSEACSSGISNLTVSFFDEDGKKLFDSNFSGISDMSNANPLTIAQYYPEAKEPAAGSEAYTKWSNYKALYGQESIDKFRAGEPVSTKELHFTVTANDAAREYKVVGDSGSGSGNITTIYYRGTSEILNLINGKDADFGDFTVSTLRNYINQTDRTYYANQKLGEILAKAQSSSGVSNINPAEYANINTNQGNVWLNFSVNPKNNPTYNISGLDVKGSEDAAFNDDSHEEGYYLYYSGSTINVSIAPGLDLSNLDTSTVTIYYQKRGDTSSPKKLFWTWNEAVAIDYAKQSGLDEATATANVNANSKNYRYTKTSAGENTDTLSTTSSLDVSSKGEIKSGELYDFIVEGFDINGQQIMSQNSDVYGFKAKTNSTVPEITIGAESLKKNLKSQSIITKSDFITADIFGFNGTFYSQDDEIAEAKYTITLADTEDAGNVKKIETVLPISVLAGSPAYTYSWNFNVAATQEMKTLLNSASGLYTVDVVISARNGGGTASVSRSYYIDTKAPEISNVSISSGYTKGNSIYLNNTKSFTLSGTTTDNYIVGETTYTFTGKDSNGNPKTVPAAASQSSITWSFENVSLSGFAAQTDATDIILTVSATDKAGNTKDETYNIEIDNTEPAGKHLYTISKGLKKDLIFRVGEASNELDELNAWNSSITALNSNLDTDVGSKYSAGTWGKEQTITIRGDWEEDGSGVAMIYYKWFTTEPTKAQIDDFKLNYAETTADHADGKFAPLADRVTKRVAYMDGTTQKFAEVDYLYKATVSGLSKGKNYLVLLAVDNVGNVGVDSLLARNITDTTETPSTAWNDGYNGISLNLDTEPPKLDSSSLSGQQYTNKVEPITVSGTCSDLPTESDASNVKSVTLAVTGKFSITATLNDAKTDWSADIADTDLKDLENNKSYNVEATVTDNAGNSSTSTIFTLKVDEDSPTVEITTPSVGAKINGKISLSGTVNYEGSLPSKLELYALTAAPTDLSFMQGEGENPPASLVASKTNAAEIYSWTFNNIDVKTKSGLTASDPSKNLYLVLAVYDAAGNCNVYNTARTATLAENTNFFKYTVDQNLDRPVIKFTNLDDSYSWVKSSVLKGSITDDDGIKTFKIKEGNNAEEIVTVTNGSWEYTFKSEDSASIPLTFTIEDNAGTTFKTGDTDLFHRPYYLYAGTSASDYESFNTFTDYGFDNSIQLSLKKDTKDPQNLAAAIAVEEAEAALADVATVNADTSDTYEIKASRFSGGDKKYLKFYIPVYDANLANVNLSIADASSGTIAIEKQLQPTPTKKTSSSVEYTYYESETIDVSSVSSGLKSVTFNAVDQAGNTTPVNYTFYIDNDGPEVPTITSPSQDDEITGTTTITGTASDSGIGIDTIEWLVPPAGTTASTSDATLLALSGWKNSNNNGTASVFKFKFQTNTDCDLVNFDNTTNYAVTHNAANGLYTIPVYFKITDKLGNYTIYKDYHITHNPDGDRPKTEINYPTDADYDVNAQGASLGYITLGGTIRVSGTVEIPSGTVEVGKVYIQIGTIDANGTPSWDKDNSTLANEFTVLGGTKDKTALGTEYGADKLIYVANDWWGIPAITKTATWNISLNTTNKLDPGSSGTTNIAIRACAINADGKMGNWSETSIIHVDKNAPSQSAIMRQYSADLTSTMNDAALEANVTVNKDYASEMYLKGKWYLVVTLEDNDSLAENSIKVKQGSAETTYYKSTTTGTGQKTKKIYIPVDTTSMTTSSVSYSVYVEDSSGYSSTGTYNFKIDNTAPVLSAITGNGDDLAENAANTVKERDYVYTVQGKLDDTGSGYERVLFYFVRNGKIFGTTTDYGTPAVLDPLVTGWNNTGDSKVALTGLEALSLGTNLPSLYAKKATGSAITGTSGTYSFTDTSSAVNGNKHIHAGGLVYIDGEYGKITVVSGATVTFTMDANPVGKTTVYFPYAASVDNFSTEEVNSSSANPFTFNSSSDDGDLMPESITNVSTTWTWKGTIHSTNIPDGPASLVVLAFDAAGNVSGNTYPVDIKNNAPRLAKLMLGTDLNSSGEISADEFSEYSITGENDAAVTITTTGSTAGQFTAKDKLAVKPEIIGGNGTISMIYKRGATGTTAVQKSNSLALVSYDANSKTSGTAGYFYTYTLSSDAVWQSLTADPANAVGVSFTFWDSTEERVQGTTSQNCVVYIPDLIIDLEDAEAPLAKIYPFYWKDKTDNSLYENKASNGHIDLEGDNGSTVPWVSGKIKITGTAYDNKMLHTIALKATGFKFNGGTAGNALTFATYNGSAWTLTKGSGTSQTAGGSITEDGWKFELDQDSEVLDQTGHTINWTLYLDTEKVAGGALNNVAVEAILTDWASKTKATADKTSAAPTTQTVKNSETPYYKMNVVPYVVGIKTNLSSLKKTNSSVYDRTALGHYSVIADNTKPIYLYGFNLKGGTLSDSAATANTYTLEEKTVSSNASLWPWYTKSSAGTTENFFKNDLNTKVYEAKIAAFTSGKVKVTVNSVESKNNANNNDSHGSYDKTVNLTTTPTGDKDIYSNYYNRLPNGDNNNLLTDDLELDVWQLNSSAAVPISGKIEQPHMAIDPVTGQIGFAFVNGPLYFSMAGSTENNAKTSYDYWMGSFDFFTSVGFTYDSLGNSYGVAAGGDINSASADKFQLMTSRWGRAGRGQNGSYSASNSLRLESIGQKTANGTRDYDKQRIKSPSLVTVVHGTDTNLYLAYYDAMNDEIRFKAGNTADSGTTYDSSVVLMVNYIDQNNTQYRYGHVTLPNDQTIFKNDTQVVFCDSNGNELDGTVYNAKNVGHNDGGNDWWFTVQRNGAEKAPFISYTDNNWTYATDNGGRYRYDSTKENAKPVFIKLKSTGTSNFGSFVDYDIYGDSYQYRNATVSMIAGSNTGNYKAGQYVSLGVIPGTTATTDIVVAAWYDKTNRKLWYSYNTTPLTNRNGNTDRTGWSTPVALFENTDYENAGEYCQIAVDKNGGIHIASYDGPNCDLIYTYLSVYNGTAQSCVVDSSGVIGSNITIDVAMNSSGKAIPRIGYYANSCVRPKLAYLVETSDATAEGSIDEAFTGKWECTIIPSDNSVNMQSNQYNKINVAVWKNNGVIKNSVTKPNTTPVNVNTPNTYNSTSYGFVYGNGTSNAVLGYAITVDGTDRIETAQMR